MPPEYRRHSPPSQTPALIHRINPNQLFHVAARIPHKTVARVRSLRLKEHVFAIRIQQNLRAAGGQPHLLLPARVTVRALVPFGFVSAGQRIELGIAEFNGFHLRKRAADGDGRNALRGGGAPCCCGAAGWSRR